MGGLVGVCIIEEVSSFRLLSDRSPKPLIVIPDRVTKEVDKRASEV